MYRVTTDPLSADALVDAVSGPEAGGIAVFLGVVRDNTVGRRVVALEYEGHVPMAEAKLKEIGEAVYRRWPAVKRVSAHLLSHGTEGIEDMGSALIVGENGMSLSIDVTWRHMGEGERFWFDLVGQKGSAGIAPLRVFKELHGTPADVTPTGASGRETMFTQSYRAEWTYFLAVIKGDVNAPPPKDQLTLHRVLEAVYRSSDEGHDVLL